MQGADRQASVPAERNAKFKYKYKYALKSIGRELLSFLKNHLVVGRWGPTEDSVAILWRCVELLAVPRHPVVVFAVLLCPASVEGDEIYGRRVRVLLLAVSPRLPGDLLLSQAAAHSAEGRAEHDGEAEAQDAQEDPLEVEEEEIGERRMRNREMGTEQTEVERK